MEDFYDEMPNPKSRKLSYLSERIADFIYGFYDEVKERTISDLYIDSIRFNDGQSESFKLLFQQSLDDYARLGVMTSLYAKIYKSLSLILREDDLLIDELLDKLKAVELPNQYIDEIQLFAKSYYNYTTNDDELPALISGKLIDQIKYLQKLSEYFKDEYSDSEVESVLSKISLMSEDRSYQAYSILQNGYGKISYNGYNRMKMEVLHDLIDTGLIYITEINPPPYSGMRYKKTKLGVITMLELDKTKND